MVATRSIIAVVASLLFVNSMAYSTSEYEDMLERRADALDARAEQLQGLAEVYRRALTYGPEEITELLERGSSSSKPEKKKDDKKAKKPIIQRSEVFNPYCVNCPPHLIDRVHKAVIKAVNHDPKLKGRCSKGRCEINGDWIQVRFHNGDTCPVSAPSTSIRM
ncbi:hypothetical protein FA13DRAFT_1739334 [Coprinellus micaceus]|uniref:Uncharacterized protein n=1 Tax=Coprinellus micaceus TaxID=71717 RepID=A0A4Y7SR04_COPMI|nr:hypothetical protein FA13DRAFT_1739334 [Coprinellus micaceus]